MIPSKFYKYLLPFLLFFFLSILYAHNLSRSVYGGDVGDLVTAASVMGVPHPPGYPLFTFLGFLLTRIDFISPAFMVGLISVFSSSLAAVLYYLLALEFTKNRFISFVSTLILSFNYLFWFYAEIAEVFALNNMFVILLFLTAFLYYKKKNINFLYALSFFVGLSFTNHQTIIFVYPSLLILVLANYKKIFSSPKIIIKNILFVILGLLIYVYVPIAAMQNPVVNWDRVKNVESFLRLILRQDYGTFNAGIFASPILEQRIIILKTYFSDIFIQSTFPVIVLSLIGSIYMFIKEKRMFFAVFLAFFLSGPLFIGYAGFPLLGSFFIGIYERFFSISSLILLTFLPFGLLFVVNLLNKVLKNKSFQNLFIGVFMIIPLSLFYYNFPKTDLHNIYIGDNLAYDMISPLPKKAILFLSGDTVLFNAWYVHYALNFRPDVTIINLSGLAGDAYFEKKINDYKKSHPAEKNDKDVTARVIKELSKVRPVFSYDSVQPSKGAKFVWIPYGLSFKLLDSEKDIPKQEELLNKNTRIWNSFQQFENNKKNLVLGSLTISEIPSIYANALLVLGNFNFSQYKDSKTAYDFYKKARDTDPNYYKTYEVLGVYYSEIKNCRKTEENLNKAIGIYPFDRIAYYLLYYNYKNCFKNTSQVDSVIKSYEKIYGKNNFVKDLKEGIKEFNK